MRSLVFVIAFGRQAIVLGLEKRAVARTRNAVEI